MGATTRKVRVRNVWQWKCLNCGVDHIEQGDPMPPEDYDEQILEALGVEPWSEPNPEDLGVMILPNVVSCECGACFETYVRNP